MLSLRRELKPVFCDIDPVTYCIDHKDLEAKITAKTKAILPVHLYGLACDMDPILAIAKKHNLYIVEDAAEAHGLTYKGKPCGSFGDISIFSFYANKLVSCGEGGMALTNNEEIFSKIKFLKDQAFETQRRFLHNEIGHNMRMTNLQAAVGLAQLERLEEFIVKKKKMAAIYDSYFKDISHVTIAPSKNEYCENIYWIYGLVLENEEQCLLAQKKLKEAKIGSRPFFYPLNKQPVYEKMNLTLTRLPITEKIALNGFYIPGGLNLTEEDIHYIGKTVALILKDL